MFYSETQYLSARNSVYFSRKRGIFQQETAYVLFGNVVCLSEENRQLKIF